MLKLTQLGFSQRFPSISEWLAGNSETILPTDDPNVRHSSPKVPQNGVLATTPIASLACRICGKLDVRDALGSKGCGYALDRRSHRRRCRPYNRKKVQEALRIYLELPEAPNFASEAAKHSEIAVVQLQANVLHLQSQVTLAKAVFQAQLATIEAKDQTILALQERLDLRVLRPETPPSKAAEDKEELVKDLVAIKKFDYKFIEFNLPEVLRKLKRYLRTD